MGIYELKLHEELVIDKGLFTIVIVRVAGGWIYNITRNNIANTVFVPFHNDMLNEQIRKM